MMRLSQAANVLNGELIGHDELFTAVSKDTRTISKGDLYVAIKGENFDGHDFIAQASTSGAVGALVSKPQSTDTPQVCVTDTRIALGELAASWRQKFQGHIIGITGSNGKTTVKEMCRNIFVQHAGEQHVMCTQGNLNNDIGMPMTLLSLRTEHEYGVIEMGANHVGEIDYLAQISRPDVAVITNVGASHIEGFGSIEKIAQAKSEIYGGLSDQGTAIINFDDDYAESWRVVCKNKRVLSFSLSSSDADVYTKKNSGNSFYLNTPVGGVVIKLKLSGDHNVMNALAAAAVAVALGVTLDNIKKGLESFSGVPGRMAVSHTGDGVCVIDDTYNANPASLAAAMKVLTTTDGEPWLVLGDMGELGELSKQLHFEAGEKAKLSGIKKLFATGCDSKYAVESFGPGGVFYKTQEDLINAVTKKMDASKVILVKGSRKMAMEKVVQAILDHKYIGGV